MSSCTFTQLGYAQFRAVISLDHHIKSVDERLNETRGFLQVCQYFLQVFCKMANFLLVVMALFGFDGLNYLLVLPHENVANNVIVGKHVHLWKKKQGFCYEYVCNKSFCTMEILNLIYKCTKDLYRVLHKHIMRLCTT